MGIKLNGISVPIGGISWEYTESGQKGIQEMFYYLESKRLLINPKEMEKKEWSEKSAIEIKNKLVDILSRYKYDQNIITIIKQMVDACNEFLDNMQRVEVRGILYKNCNSLVLDLIVTHSLERCGEERRSTSAACMQQIVGCHNRLPYSRGVCRH